MPRVGAVISKVTFSFNTFISWRNCSATGRQWPYIELYIYNCIFTIPPPCASSNQEAVLAFYCSVLFHTSFLFLWGIHPISLAEIVKALGLCVFQLYMVQGLRRAREGSTQREMERMLAVSYCPLRQAVLRSLFIFSACSWLWFGLPWDCTAWV